MLIHLSILTQISYLSHEGGATLTFYFTKLIMAATPMESESDLDRCLALIRRRTTDNEKFVGLLLLPRLLADPDRSVLHAVKDALDFNFVERLIRNSGGLTSLTEH